MASDVFEVKGSRVFLEGKEIGRMTRTMEGKKAYISPRDRARHFFRKYEGFGIAKNLLELLKANGFEEIQFRIGIRETLISSVEDWKTHGVVYSHPQYETQLILPEIYMKKRILPLSAVMR